MLEKVEMYILMTILLYWGSDAGLRRAKEEEDVVECSVSIKCNIEVSGGQKGDRTSEKYNGQRYVAKLCEFTSFEHEAH